MTQERVLTPERGDCASCRQRLWIAYTKRRRVVRLDGVWRLTLRVRRCRNRACALYRRPPEPRQLGPPPRHRPGGRGVAIQLRVALGQPPPPLCLRRQSEPADRPRMHAFCDASSPRCPPGGRPDEAFDCVLGNPPWDQVELKEEEFFAVRAPDIVAGGTGAERKRRIEALAETDPALYQLFVQERFAYDRQRKFLQNSGRFPLTGRGRTNLYSVFAENDRSLISLRGRVGVIVQTGIATDDTNKAFFGDIVSKWALASLYDFENREGLFPAIDSRTKFCLLTLTGDHRGPERADLVCFALRTEDLLDVQRHFILTAADFALINPNTRTLPIFRSRRDADLTRRMYGAAPVLVDESGGEPSSAWKAALRRGSVNMSTDEKVFRTRAWLEDTDFVADSLGIFHKQGTEPYWPLFEGSMLHQFDHRFATFEHDPRADEPKAVTAAQHADATYEPLGRYWLPEIWVQEAPDWKRAWLIAFRDTARSTDERCSGARSPQQSTTTLRGAQRDAAGRQDWQARQRAPNLSGFAVDFAAFCCISPHFA